MIILPQEDCQPTNELAGRLWRMQFTNLERETWRILWPWDWCANETTYSGYAVGRTEGGMAPAEGHRRQIGIS